MAGRYVPPFFFTMSFRARNGDSLAEFLMKEELRRFFCGQRGHCNRFAAGTDDFHLFPVVGEFLAAVETHDIGAGDTSRWTAPAFLHRNREAVAFVSATEKCVQNPGNHPTTSTGMPRQNWDSGQHLLT